MHSSFSYSCYLGVSCEVPMKGGAKMKRQYAGGHPESERAFKDGIMDAVKLGLTIGLLLSALLLALCLLVFHEAKKMELKASQKIERYNVYDQHE